MDKRLSKTLWTAIVVAALFVAVVITFSVRTIARQNAMVTPKNFQQVQIGMTRAELHSLLGPPRHERLVLGVIKDAQTITVNLSTDHEQLRSLEYLDYVMESWSSPAITIMAFTDAKGEVVCRYSSAGQSQTLLGLVWPRKRVTLASTGDSISHKAD
ncbi:MAG TPA: hypothetical protein P5307_29055 [Pirellulaceae bacterium]|nr:hypothetical protein [Pirellulaceae bacterium]